MGQTHSPCPHTCQSTSARSPGAACSRGSQALLGTGLVLSGKEEGAIGDWSMLWISRSTKEGYAVGECPSPCRCCLTRCACTQTCPCAWGCHLPVVQQQLGVAEGQVGELAVAVCVPPFRSMAAGDAVHKAGAGQSCWLQLTHSWICFCTGCAHQVGLLLMANMLPVLRKYRIFMFKPKFKVSSC